MADSLKFLIELEDKFSSPANKVLSSVGKLADSLGEIGGFLGPLIKVEAALVGIGAAAVLGGAALAIHASEAKQDTLDMLDAMLGSHEAATDTYAKIEALGDDMAISLERGSQLARELSAAGLTNKDQLVAAIKSIGEVESVLGKSAGGKIQSLIEKSQASGVFKLPVKGLAGTGIEEGVLAQRLGVTKKQLESGQVNAQRGVAALTSLLDEKFGGVAKKQALDLGNQFTRLKDNVSKLFEDVDNGPFLEAFSSIVKIFDQSTESGKALKLIVTGFFNGLFRIVAKGGPYVTTFLKGLVIIGLKAYIALKPIAKAFGDVGDQANTLDLVAGTMSRIGDAIAFVIEQLTPAIIFWGKFAGVMMDVVGILAQASGAFYTAGVDLIGGLINGIMSGAEKVGETVRNIAQSAIDKFTSVLGIHSDSKVMAKMGEHMMGGLESGIAANDNGPKDALAGSVEPSAVRGGGGGSTSVIIGPGAIVIQINGSNAQEISSQLKQVLPGELASMFESLGLSVGAA